MADGTLKALAPDAVVREIVQGARRSVRMVPLERERLAGMSFRDFIAETRAPLLRILADHWQQARGARRMPGWRDIDATRLGPCLANVWAWRFDAASDDFIGRLGGENVRAVLGKSMRGVPMRDLFQPGVYEEKVQRLRHIITEPCFMYERGPIFLYAGRWGPGERIALPLAEDGVHADGIIGMTVYELLSRPGDKSALDRSQTAEERRFFPLD